MLHDTQSICATGIEMQNATIYNQFVVQERITASVSFIALRG